MELPDLHGWLAGCDGCQEVCPWNKFAKPSTEPHFAPIPELAHPDPTTFVSDPEGVAHVVEGTALKRTGPEALTRNARRVLGSASRRNG